MSTLRLASSAIAAALAGSFIAACDEIPEDGGTTGTGGAGGVPETEGTPLDVPVNDQKVYVDLDVPAVVDAGAAWDIAFQGRNVFTNGGVSGSAQGSAFGPLDQTDFNADLVPAEVPFMIDDIYGGPFVDWWMYEPSEHVIYSRFHVFGVRRGSEHYKVQLISFYGEVSGAPAAALYRFRVAHVTPGGSEATVIYDEFDGTAGGPDPSPSSPSGCLVLATGQRLELTPDQAKQNADWDLCFRRDAVSVNGGEGGPGGVLAVDLDIDETPSESLDDVMARTETTELARFDAVDYQAISNAALAYKGDGVISAFTDFWTKAKVSPLEPAAYSFLVAGADGVTPFFVIFDSFTGATADNPGTVHMRVKKIGGGLP
ncbi:MAG: hypothetical protein HOV80_08140 [Polyangiaceae bacterium]|nr:hypothetical protein [Polyangiaceae bacterium]